MKENEQQKENSLDALDDLMHQDPAKKHKKYLFAQGQGKSKTLLAAMRWLGGAIAVALILSTLTLAPTIAAAASLNAAVNAWDAMPADDLPFDTVLPQHTILLDKNGKEFAQFFSENRTNVKLDEVNPQFIKSLIATEDTRFYENNGFDVKGNVRSVLNNVTGGSKQGASGITQQLVKTMLKNNAASDEAFNEVNSRSYMQKLKELKYAVNVENTKSKEEILTLYLNTVYFGHGAYGIGAAAKTYFDTTADKLTADQSAVLVGVINSPTAFDPFLNMDNALVRRVAVVQRMVAENIITAEEGKKINDSPIALKEGKFVNGCGQSSYPYYCALVRKELLTNVAYGATAEAREANLYRGGLTISTALDPVAMDAAQAEVEAAYGNDNRVGAGVAIIVPGTGHIAAIAQNRTWGSGPGQTEVIYADSKRQVGSSFKPFTLATALEQGIPATTQMVSNSPYIPSAGFDYPQGGFANYGYANYGSVDAYQATKASMNIYFVKLMERTGVLPVADMAKRLGINSLPREGPNAIGPQALSLTLGSYEITPIEMANAYSTFAASGVACNTVTIVGAIRTETKEKLDVSDPACHQAIMPNIANTMSSVLQEPLKAGGSAQDLNLNGRIVAAKTGTTNDWADGWVVGYTPQYATSVWAGDPRGGSAYPLTEYVQYGVYHAGGISGDGSMVAGPIWKAVMNDIHQGLPAKNFTKPDNSISMSVLAQSVPDVTGMNVDEAMTLLVNNGYTVALSQETTGDAKLLPENVVVKQNPTAGTNGSFEQTITLTLSPNSDTTIKAPQKAKK